MLQNFLCARSEVFGELKSLIIRHKNIVVDNVCILDSSQGHFSLDFTSAQSLCALSNQEALDFTAFSFIASPSRDVVSKSGVADPSLATINQVASFDFLGRSLD